MVFKAGDTKNVNLVLREISLEFNGRLSVPGGHCWAVWCFHLTNTLGIYRRLNTIRHLGSGILTQGLSPRQPLGKAKTGRVQGLCSQ